MARTRPASARDLRALPKAHLHLHLEGSAPRRWVAERLGADVDRDFTGFATFAEFQAAYARVRDLVRTPEDLASLLDALLEQEAADGVRYVEPTFRPYHYAERFGWPAADVLDLATDVLERASARLAINVGLQVAVDHTMPASTAEAIAAFAAEHGPSLASFGINGDDTATGPAPFARACAIAREASLAIVPHTGEFSGPDRIIETVELLRPSRIAHGVRGARDPRVVERLFQESVPLDLCVTSNVALGVVTDVKSHPAWELARAGIPITLNADDSFLFGNGILAEYELARDVGGLSDATLSEIARTSIRASARLAPRERLGLLREIDAWLV